MNLKLGFAGTGLLGNPMAEMLLINGYNLRVYNRTAEKIKNLTSSGALPALSPEELFAECNAVILMLADYSAINSVLFNGKYINLTGKTVIQAGTISPRESINLEIKLNTLGCSYLEAPVLGSIMQAKNKELVVMAGGEKTLAEKFEPVFNSYGNMQYIGQTGSAAAMKLAQNQLIGSLTLAFSGSLQFVINSGLDVNQFMTILKGSALFAPTFEKKLGNMTGDKFQPANFPLKHLLKDTALIIEAFAVKGLSTELQKVISEKISEGIAAGFADEDYSVIYKTLSKKE